MGDRYGFDKFNMDKSDTHFYDYDSVLLSNQKDEKISERRKQRIETKENDKRTVKAKLKAERKARRQEKKRQLRKERAHGKKLVAMVLIFAAAVAFISYESASLLKLSIEKMETQKELQRLNSKLEQLTDELGEVDSPEYVENTARSELHMIKEGEVMYIVNPSETTETNEDSAK